MLSYVPERKLLDTAPPVKKQPNGISTNPKHNKPLQVFRVDFVLVDHKDNYGPQEHRHLIAKSYEDAERYLYWVYSKDPEIKKLMHVTVTAPCEIRALTPSVKKQLYLALKDDNHVQKLLEADQKSKVRSLTK